MPSLLVSVAAFKSKNPFIGGAPVNSEVTPVTNVLLAVSTGIALICSVLKPSFILTLGCVCKTALAESCVLIISTTSDRHGRCT